MVTRFEWDDKRTAAAIALAEGYTQQEVAEKVEVAPKTIWNWLQVTEFAAEVDRLSLMMGIASRAERLRLAMRVVRQKTGNSGVIETEKDILDWVKFAQSETDGIKLDLSKLAAIAETETSVADSGSGRRGSTEEPNKPIEAIH